MYGIATEIPREKKKKEKTKSEPKPTDKVPMDADEPLVEPSGASFPA